MTDAEILATARIEKRPYAANPWRVVAADGRQLTVPSTITYGDGRTMPFPKLLAYPTKRAAVAALAALRDQYATQAPEAA